jgi:hypothetical protein
MAKRIIINRRRIKPIGTVTEELKACRAAFKKYPNTIAVWCCHHARLYESNNGYKDRLRYIAQEKPHHEKAERYRNFRPIIGNGRTRAAFNREWPNNTWNGYTIFTD